MRTLIAMTLLIGSSAAFAATECTTADKSTWQDQEKFQAQLKEQGYKINKFKVSGECYEIYGKNKDNKKVEIYFDTVSGKPVKSEVQN